MRVLIRTDASEAIGTGHLMRCLALGASLKRQGASVTLACASLPPALAQLARSREIGLVEVTPAAEPELDARSTLAAAGGEPVDWLVVDHYGLAAEWESRMRNACKRVLAIDDLANRPHDCDLLLDQNLREDGGSAYDTRLPRGCERLLGPRFALLDTAFAAARSAPVATQRDGILISFGGSDPYAQTLPVLRALWDLTRGTVSIDVAAGTLNRDAEAIQAFAAGSPNVAFHRSPRNMAGLMARAAVYVGAGGSTNWERCCLGLPGAIVSVADNQVGVCAALEDAGCHVYLGDAVSTTPEAMATAAFALLRAPSWRARLADRSAALVDGHGAERVATRISAGDVKLRPAMKSDEQVLLDWRNHPDVRRYSTDAAEIGREEHSHWFCRVLADRNRQMLIGEDNGGPLGVLRYDFEGRAATVSIYLVPNRLGQGAGSRLLAAGERWVAAEHPELSEIRARARPANHASVRLFADAGYRPAISEVSKSLLVEKRGK